MRPVRPAASSLLWLACAALAWTQVAAQPTPAGEAWGLEQLMLEFAAVQRASARFVERKHLKILDRPLELTGTLEYRAPDHLARRTLTPRPESFVVDGDRLRLEDARGRKRSFALQDNPLLWAFVESIRSTLNGDLPQLESFYEIALAGGRAGWRLSLTPKQPRMRALVEVIRIAGRGDRIDSVEIHEAKGDRSIMTVIEGDP